jgi:peptidoglycan-N-acetylglucosamine deacetylase
MTMLKWTAVLATGVVCLATLAWQGNRFSSSRTHQLIGDLVTRAETTDSVVALTFDDGPTPIHTDSVIALLAEFDVPATFFMIGQFMERPPDVVTRVVEAGHELANHSYSHPRLVLKSPRTIRREIERTDSLIRAAGHVGEIWVRPPYGKRLFGLPYYLSRRDRPVVLWNLEPDTYNARAEGMVDYVHDRVTPGSIILLHVEIPARSEGRRALRRIVPELTSRGYRFVTLSELLRRSSAP